MKIFVLFATILISTHLTAQKPALQVADLENWPTVEQPAISNNGRYAKYNIKNDPTHNNTLVINSLQFNWELKIIGGSNALFSRKSDFLVFQKGADSLGILRLAERKIEYVGNVSSFTLSQGSLANWLIYQSNQGSNEATLYDLDRGQSRSFSSVLEYKLIDESNSLLLMLQGADGKLILDWINLSTGEKLSIWKGSKINSIVVDKSGNQLAFLSPDESRQSIFYFKNGMPKVELVTDESQLEADNSWHISWLPGFSQDGSKLFINSEKIDTPIKPRDEKTVKVDVWSYRDPKLQSQQLAERNAKFHHTIAFNIQSRKSIQLEQNNERLLSNLRSSGNRYALLVHDGPGDEVSEWNWNKTATHSVYLVSIDSGERRLILPANGNHIPLGSMWLSPDEKYILYFDPKKTNYFCYCIASGITRNLTENIKTIWTTYLRDDEPLSAYETIGVAGWLEGDSSVLIYDQNDIYQFSPEGKHPSVNLTRGYGRSHHITFRLVGEENPCIPPNAEILLTAFNRANKENGFFKLSLRRTEEPKLLVMQPYLFEGSYENDRGLVQAPLKALDTNVYLVRRMSAESSSNYFITTDFKHFSAMSDIHPENKFNWLTSELITWKTFDGVISQGILYKPENFDPGKKYPVIFNYYEQRSDGLHEFPEPDLSSANINIAQFVSNGYLVFVPDIHYVIGHPGRSAYNSVVSAAKYLTQKPWVNAFKIGIQGHSFGGYQTDWIVTHSKSFAAACSASGWADFINAYNAIREYRHGISRQFYYEMFRERMGGTLWQRPDLYVENSPVLSADKIKTPLLLMNNKTDDDVSFAFGLEFFLALRRLGKKAWMLQYDGENHSLLTQSAKMDFTIRMKQFFDHYLKGMPAPKWMVVGVPAKIKGLDLGYDLQPDGIEPGPGLQHPF